MLSLRYSREWGDLHNSIDELNKIIMSITHHSNGMIKSSLVSAYHENPSIAYSLGTACKENGRITYWLETAYQPQFD